MLRRVNLRKPKSNGFGSMYIRVLIYLLYFKESLQTNNTINVNKIHEWTKLLVASVHIEINIVWVLFDEHIITVPRQFRRFLSHNRAPRPSETTPAYTDSCKWFGEMYQKNILISLKTRIGYEKYHYYCSRNTERSLRFCFRQNYYCTVK